MLDFGAMEGSLVGESEGMIRHAIAVIKAVGQGHAYFIATSNNASVMRPEVQRRFTDGMFFFDVPSDEERKACWAFYMKKYELKRQPMPKIRDGPVQRFELLPRLVDTNSPLVESARFIVRWRPAGPMPSRNCDGRRTTGSWTPTIRELSVSARADGEAAAGHHVAARRDAKSWRR